MARPSKRKIADPTPWTPKPNKADPPAVEAKPKAKKDRIVRPPFEPATGRPPPWTDLTTEELLAWPPRGEPEPDDVIAARIASPEQRWRYNASMLDSVTLDGEKAVVSGAWDDHATIASIDPGLHAKRHKIRVPWIEVYKRRRPGTTTDFRSTDASSRAV